MLEKERFLAIKKLARDIRRDNKKLFEDFEDEPVEVAVRKKNDFLESVVNNMSSAFSDGEQGKEERQIFRANILIPDDDEFYETYSNDKNIRNLMNKYSVNIEDIMSKITELNIYSKYLEESKDEDFTDEMVKISPKEAEDLLDEIDSLSNTLTNLDLNLGEYEEETPKFIKPRETVIKDNSVDIKVKEPVEKEVSKVDDDISNDDFLGDSFDNINSALSDFVTDYNSLKDEVASQSKYIKSLEKNVKNLKIEKEKIERENKEVKTENSEIKNENSELKNENSDLKNERDNLNRKMKALEDKLYKSMTLLKKVYTGIKD